MQYFCILQYEWDVKNLFVIGKKDLTSVYLYAIMVIVKGETTNE